MLILYQLVAIFVVCIIIKMNSDIQNKLILYKFILWYIFCIFNHMDLEATKPD